MKNIEGLRILEVGQFCLLKRNLPEQTTLVYTGNDFSRLHGLEYIPFGLRIIPWLQRSLSSGNWDIVFCHSPIHPVWDTRHGMVDAVRHLLRQFRNERTFASSLLDRTIDCPLVMLDFNDESAIPGHVFPLLDRCTLYFKRELPADFAKAFLNASADLRYPANAHSSDFFNRNAHKLRPISLAVPESTARLASSLEPEKENDVFFAGSIHTTVRQQGLPVLTALREQGYRIDVCQDVLPKEHYLERCAKAWLTWSPEGYGWDCFRHYEASLCHSVPVMNFPGIFRHAPLLDGVHGFLYPVEGDGLRNTLIAALSDKSRLKTMAANARRHVLSHHTHSRIIEHILSSCLPETLNTTSR